MFILQAEAGAISQPLVPPTPPLPAGRSRPFAHLIEQQKRWNGSVNNQTHRELALRAQLHWAAQSLWVVKSELFAGL